MNRRFTGFFTGFPRCLLSNHPAVVRRFRAPIALFATALFAVLATAGCRLPGSPPPGNAKTGYAVWGYVGHSSMSAASNQTVMLLDGQSGETTAQTETDLMGKYAFSGLKPGSYRLKTGEVVMNVEVAGENVRVDIDLSSSDGQMDYASGGALPTAGGEQAAGDKGAPAASGAAPAGGAQADANVAQQLAGAYWGYSGSTESKIGLCAGGRYYDYSESSYSGTLTDDLGNQTGAWGAAGQNESAGTWSAQGNAQQGTITVVEPNGEQWTMEYHAGKDAGCYFFGNRQLCRQGDCQ